MKYRNTIFLLMFAIVLMPALLPQFAGIYAQHQKGSHRFSPEEFVQKCDCYITDYAKLTPQEAQKFLPLYHAMKDAQRKLMHEKGSLLHNAIKEGKGDKESQKTLDKLNALDRQALDIETEYQKKMLKVISASKLLRVKDAEKKFERRVLHKMANRPKPKD